MTVGTAAQVAAHSVSVPNLRTPALILGKSIGRLLMAFGRVLIDVSKAYALAQELAYVRPGGVALEEQRLTLDTDGEGRDPSW